MGLLWMGTACGFVSDKELADRLDADDDGLSRRVDCDDTNPAITVFRYYVDLDQDGYGDALADRVEGCELRPGLSETPGDCDDTRPLVSPGGQEVCNQLDDDCNGRADDDVVDLREFYQDSDGDGFGNPLVAVGTCFAPEGYVANSSDCDDSDASTFGVSTWYVDADGDGWGDPRSTVVACAAASGTVARGGDCDDTAADVHPDAVEVCDGASVDEDCDGAVDDADASVDLSAGVAVWPDADGDGFGDAGHPSVRCAPDPAAGWVDNRDDCDDTDPSVTVDDCPFLRVSAGTTASCAVRGDHRLVCWGDDLIALNAPDGTFLDVAVGVDHGCGLALDGTLDCWGGTGVNTFESLDPLTEVEVDGGYTCAFTDDTDLQCWNGGVEYRIGVADQDFIDFEVGTSHACGLMSDGEGRCLGVCDSLECAVPAGPWLDLAAGREFTCGVDEKGAVLCWGDHSGTPRTGVFEAVHAYGRNACAAGVGGELACWSSSAAFPGLTPPTDAFDDWDVGGAHGCGIRSADGTLVCWGNDSYGQSSPPAG